jgi:RND family efflux transporter MFP subunit
MNPKILAPILILALTGVGVFLLVATAPSVEHVEPERAIPTVRVIEATPQTLRHTVRSQGTVVPRNETNLVAEVSGRVVWIAPNFAPGGFFQAGEPLIRLEARDYELARNRQRAAVQRARSERTFAAAELQRQRGLSEGGVASPSKLADAVRAATVAEAGLLDAQAALEQAERDLDRTEIVAPFAGRIRDEQVDVGQYVARGTAFGRVYATDYAEIRLPIPDDQLAFMNVGTPVPGVPLELDGAPVRLSAIFAGQRAEWAGWIVRTEGEIDPRSRMVHVVARVEDPYKSDIKVPSVPLAVGLFVQAEIEGPEVENAIVLPRYAMRNDSKILVVDEQSRLHSREVQILRIDRDEVLVQGPLAEGERICVSPLQVVIEGMQVRIVYENEAAAKSKAAAGNPGEPS